MAAETRRGSFYPFAMCVLFFLITADSAASDWTPSPRFNVEGASYTETMIFVSGLMYAISYSDNELIMQGKENFFCPDTQIHLDSKLAIELLNTKLEGRQSSEAVTATLIKQLRSNFPCEK